MFLLHGCTQKYQALSKAKPSVYLGNSETFSGQALSVFRFMAAIPGWELAIRFFPLDKLHPKSKVKQAELHQNRIFFFTTYLKIRHENTMKSLFIPDL